MRFNPALSNLTIERLEEFSEQKRTTRYKTFEGLLCGVPAPFQCDTC